jgi:hypothetical protein
MKAVGGKADKEDLLGGNRHHREDHLQDHRVDGTHHLNLGVHKAVDHLMACPHHSSMHHRLLLLEAPQVYLRVHPQVRHRMPSHQQEVILGVGVEGLCLSLLHLDVHHPLLVQIIGVAVQFKGAGTKVHLLHLVVNLVLV